MFGLGKEYLLGTDGFYIEKTVATLQCVSYLKL